MPCRENERLVQELSIPAPNSKDLHFETRYPQSALSQFRLIFWKCVSPSTSKLLGCQPRIPCEQTCDATDIWSSLAWALYNQMPCEAIAHYSTI